ncbi:MAG: TetR/AcrR family transcriptional regulator C-terminal domain-containing protein [Anaerolineae bacterium]|nr:TetR/AcrR family transcriptional regulator C-terminal domain-containing protein [Anaerolineae bacterium]
MPRVRIRFDTTIKTEVQMKVALNTDQIVQAALQLLDQMGLDGLTMRRLADNLGVKAASLYWHVKDKDELIVLLANALCGSLNAPDPARSWREQLAQFADEYRRRLLSHRDAARVMLLSGPPSGANRLDLVEMLLGVLLKAGYSAQDAAFGSFLLNDYVTTFVMEETRDTDLPTEDSAGEALPEEADTNWIDMLPPDRYPNIRTLAPHWRSVNMDEQFRFGVEVLLDGLEKRLTASSRPNA